MTTLINNQRTERRQIRAFTLIEMIGVLAVIAILAALLLPKVFSAINEARVSNTAVGVNTLKTAITDHYGKYNALNASNSATAFLNVPIVNYDELLMAENLLDKPFASRLSTNTVVQLVLGTAANNNAGYNLGANSQPTTNQTYTAEVVLNGVLAQDAYDLSQEVDGPSLSTTNNLTVADTWGRVEYGAPVNGITTVYVYLTGR